MASLSCWGRALGALLGCVGWAALAAADVPHAHLAWSRPAASMCPSADVIKRDVAQLLGYDPFGHGGAADLLLEGAVEERATEVYARIAASTASGQSLGARELTGPRGECAALRKPIALIIGLFLEAEPARVARPRVPIWWGGFVAARSGLLPRTTPGVGASLLARVRPRLDLALQASYWFPVVIETRAGLGARFQALDATTGVCPRLTPTSGTVALFLCGALQAGVLLASPRGLEGPTQSVRLSAGALFELKLLSPLGRRFALEGALGAVAALAQPLFYLTRADGTQLDVHRPARFGALLRLTLFFELPS